MSFVRAKEIPPHSGNWYDYEVMTTHVNGKVMQKVVQYLGKHGGDYSGQLIGNTGNKSSRPALQVQTMPVNPVNQATNPVSTIVVCKHCQSTNVSKYGTAKGVQQYWCKECERKFENNGAIPEMKTPARQGRARQRTDL